jgi:hypothetical protein
LFLGSLKRAQMDGMSVDGLEAGKAFLSFFFVFVLMFSKGLFDFFNAFLILYIFVAYLLVFK